MTTAAKPPRWRWSPTRQRMELGARGDELFAMIARSPQLGAGGPWFGRAWLAGEPIASVCIDGVTDAAGGRHECRKRLERAIAIVQRRDPRRAT